MLLPISLRRFNILCLAAFVAAQQKQGNRMLIEFSNSEELGLKFDGQLRLWPAQGDRISGFASHYGLTNPELSLSTQFLKFPKLLINCKINIYLPSLSTALAAKIFTMKSLFMPALYRFIFRLIFEGSRFNRFTLKRRNRPRFSAP